MRTLRWATEIVVSRFTQFGTTLDTGLRHPPGPTPICIRKMLDRSYSRPYYDSNGCYTDVFHGRATHMNAEEFAVFKAKLEEESEQMAVRREVFLIEQAKRAKELG